ncbi:hypothetical protein MPH_02622 [Macrophomina phaseolina MS6]|uniref:Uncharacterized protein n=1 Tax=Macrophomina phaseolina (strain MS6) TaxID=1126212 RepID=K2RZC6_MACPH|nr:hypothetical protein MPH_02622 [Macrophomina phaseolina MS6]
MALPYTSLDYNETFRYCKKTHYCKTDNPYDVDIAGIGVLVSFIATAAFTLLSIVVGYLCEWLPGTDTNHVDQVVILTVTTCVKFCFRPSLTRLRKFRDRLSTPSIRKSHYPDELAKKWSAALERFILALSDQQLVTGIAIMATIYMKACDISIYSFQMAAALAWFSSTTHLATLVILTSYFDSHRVARNFRAFMMVSMMIMLAVAQIISNSESVQHSATDGYFGCALKKSFKLSPANGYEAFNLTLIIAWLITSYSSRMISLYSPRRGSTKSWPTRQVARFFRLELVEPTEEDDSLAKLHQVVQDVDDHLRHGPLRRWTLLRRMCTAYTYFFSLAGAIERAFTNSFLWHLIWLFFGATFGIEAKDEIERHPLNQGSLSPTSDKEDDVFEMTALASSTEDFAAPLTHRATDTSIAPTGSVYDLPLARVILVFYIVLWLGLSQLVAVSAATNFSDLGLLIPLVLVLAGLYIWSVVIFEIVDIVNAFRRKRAQREGP